MWSRSVESKTMTVVFIALGIVLTIYFAFHAMLDYRLWRSMPEQEKL